MKNRTYRYFAGEPLYPFGFGLTYSRFEYNNLKLSTPELEAGTSLGVEVDVSNIGERDGDEVVELYLNFPKSPGAPHRALVDSLASTCLPALPDISPSACNRAI